MKLKNIINEMSAELIPSLSSTEDLSAIKQLKRIHKTDPKDFEKKLYRINLIRKSHKLPPLSSAEILSKNLTIKEILRKAKYEKKEVKHKKMSAKEEKKYNKKTLVIIDNIVGKSSVNEFVKDKPAIRKKLEEIKDGFEASKYKKSYPSVFILKSFGKTFYVLFFRSYGDYYEGKQPIDDLNKIWGVFNSPLRFKMVNNSIVFPEIGRILQPYNSNFYTGMIKKL